MEQSPRMTRQERREAAERDRTFLEGSVNTLLGLVQRGSPSMFQAQLSETARLFERWHHSSAEANRS